VPVGPHLRHTRVLSHAAVQASRGEVPLPVATETGVWGLSWAVLWCAAALLSHQGIGWVKELSVRHRLTGEKETVSNLSNQAGVSEK